MVGFVGLRCSIDFQKYHVDKKKQKQILDSLKSNRIGELVLSSLMQAFALNKNVSIKDMQLKAIEITISLPPYVTIQYEK